MLKEAELKIWLSRSLDRSDKALLILSTFDKPAKVREISERGIKGGLRAISKWNLSSILSRTNGLAINTPDGWELADTGKLRLRQLGVTKISVAATQVATDLRVQLSLINDNDTKAFMEEAVKCFEAELYRSAVVMSWLAAVHTLYRNVHKKHLVAFNAEANRIDAKWKTATSVDGLGRMKEADFLDRIAGISMIGKNVKEELLKCLKLRNGCGHPNSLKVGPNAVASHIEILLLNVFKTFP